MRNLIEPQKLAELKSKPINYETIEKFLRDEPKVSAGYVCKLIGVPPSSFYSWRVRQERSEISKKLIGSPPSNDVTPTGVGKKRYSPEDKVALLRNYQWLEI